MEFKVKKTFIWLLSNQFSLKIYHKQKNNKDKNFKLFYIFLEFIKNVIFDK